MTTVSAPGKVILMGEHAVVYGKPALISALNLRLTASVYESDKLEIITTEGVEYIKHILNVVCHHFKIGHLPPLKIEIVSNIPIGYHLGSSAAVGVALVGALAYHLKHVWNPTLINQLAYEAEKFVHQNASGVDPAAVVSGGLIWYRKELDFLRSIWQFPFGIPQSLSNFFLLDTGRPKETTGEMVALVERRTQNSMTKMKSLFDENERQTKRVAIALKTEDEKMLIEALRKGQQTLEGMGVVSNKVIPIVRRIEQAGGAAKILGGGGRRAGVGHLLVYATKPPEGGVPITLGAEGVRLEKKA